MSRCSRTRKEIQNNRIIFKISQSNKSLQQPHRLWPIKYSFISKKSYNFFSPFLTMTHFFIKQDGGWSHSFKFKFRKKSLNTRYTISICSKPNSIIAEFLAESFRRETPAASCWRLYDTAGGSRDGIITICTICFYRHITWLPISSWIIIRIRISSICFFCPWQSTYCKGIYAFCIHQYVVMAV